MVRQKMACCGLAHGAGFRIVSDPAGANISLADRMPFGTFLCLAIWIAWLTVT